LEAKLEQTDTYKMKICGGYNNATHWPGYESLIITTESWNIFQQGLFTTLNAVNIAGHDTPTKNAACCGWWSRIWDHSPFTSHTPLTIPNHPNTPSIVTLAKLGLIQLVYLYYSQL